MTDPTFHLTTPRLFISYLQPTPEHADFIVALYNTPEFIASIGGTPTSIQNREAALNLITNRFPSEHARNGFGAYLFSLRPPSPSPFPSGSIPLGTVSLMQGEGEDRYGAPDLGFCILSEYMRKGYAKEAAQAVMEYVEREKGVKDLLGFCNPKNEASKATMRSLGFEERGVRELRVFGGEEAMVWVKGGREVEELGL